MDIQNSFPFWDNQRNFYELIQEGKNFRIKKDGEIIFEGCLLKLKKVAEHPVRPFIVNDKLFLFDYNRGLEMHRLDGSERKFFDVRAVWQAVFTDSMLFLQKQVNLVTIDIEKEEVIEKVSVTESFHIKELAGFLLFYQFKRRKSYLYNIRTRTFTELPKFSVMFALIQKVMKKEDRLIVFYSSSQELKNRNGVYIYDLKMQRGEFYCGLSDFSAYCHRYLPLLDFSFNEEVDVRENQFDGYITYLYFILKRFGLFALLYYINDAQLDQAGSSPAVHEIKTTLKYFKEKMRHYPNSNQEFNLLLDEMRAAEEQLKYLDLE